jgi:AraC-like DNA-binding protein
MLRRPTISARFLIALRTVMQMRGLDLASLSQTVGLPPQIGVDPDAEISFGAFIDLFELAAFKTGDEAFGIHFAESMPPRPTGVFQHIIFNSRTLGQAFQAMARFIGLVTNAFNMRYEEKDGAGWLTLELPADTGAKNHFADGQLAIVALRARQLAGAGCVPMGVYLEREQPKALAEFERVFGPKITFASPDNRIGFELSTLAKELPEADKDLLRAVENYGLLLLGQKVHGAGVAGDISQYISQALQRGEATEAGVCKALNITTRTLQRELAAEGTAFATLLEQTRIKMARYYLIESDLSLTAIAFLLGYSELSAFSRAARGWFDDTPSGYRKKNAHAGTPKGSTHDKAPEE